MGVSTASIDWLTPAERMPWPVTTPFRMRPNLEKLDADAPALLLRDELADVCQRERAKVWATHAERASVGSLDRDVERVIASLTPSPLEGEGWGEGEADSESNLNAPNHLPPLPQPLSLRGRGESLALALQEDFVILKNEAGRMVTEYLSVAFPSRWDPREKLGLDFAAIHAPVADNQMLRAAGSSIVAMAFMKQPMLRHVWLVVPSASLAQHPDQNDYSWSETLRDPSPLLPRLFFRVERQTTWPLPQFERAVFFIRVMMCSLPDVLRETPTRAQELRAALASMTSAVVSYRGMTDAMPRLLDELESFQ